MSNPFLDELKSRAEHQVAYSQNKVGEHEWPFPVGARVASGRWGEGTVQRYDGDQVTVLFDEHGYRDLLVPLVIQRRLLTAA